MSDSHPPPSQGVVHVIDDEPAYLQSLVFLMEGMGFEVWPYPHAEAFLNAQAVMSPQGSCVLSDIRMPRLSGLELQRRLHGQTPEFPIVFMTGHGDIDQAVLAMRAGAVHFLQKPFKEQDLLDALNQAVALGAERWLAWQRQRLALDHWQQLSAREQDVAKGLARGLSHKELARELGISHHTVHVHRQHITDKLGASGSPELLRLMAEAGLVVEPPTRTAG